MLGTPLTQEGWERDKASVEAAASPAEHGTHSGYLHAVHGPVVEEQDPWDEVCTQCHQGCSPPGLSSRHSIVLVLTYLPIILNFPNWYSVTWNPSLFSDLL